MDNSGSYGRKELTVKQLIAQSMCAIATELRNNRRYDEFKVVNDWFDELRISPEFVPNPTNSSFGYYTFTFEQLDEIEFKTLPIIVI